MLIKNEILNKNKPHLAYPIHVTAAGNAVVAVEYHSLMRWRVYPRDQNQIPVGVHKYCDYHWFMCWRHYTELDE